MKLRLLCSFNVHHWFFSSQSQGCHIYLIFDGSALNQQLRKRNHIVKNYVLRLFTRSPLQIAVWYSIINYSLTCTCGKNEHSYSLMSLWSAYLDLCHLDYCHKLNWIICTLNIAMWIWFVFVPVQWMVIMIGVKWCIPNWPNQMCRPINC